MSDAQVVPAFLLLLAPFLSQSKVEAKRFTSSGTVRVTHFDGGTHRRHRGYCHPRARFWWYAFQRETRKVHIEISCHKRRAFCERRAVAARLADGSKLAFRRSERLHS